CDGEHASPRAFATNASSHQPAKKHGKAFLQGLKPIGFGSFTPGLKLRPPKDETFSASCGAMRHGSRVSDGFQPSVTLLRVDEPGIPSADLSEVMLLRPSLLST